jgi:hypothetical protein
VASSQYSQNNSAMSRVRFDLWAEFARFMEQDSSTRGVFVRAAVPAAIGSEINVQFLLPDGSDLVLQGRVVHRLSAEEARAMGEHAGMGVQFTQLSAEQAQYIEGLLAGVAARQAQRASTPATASGKRSSAPPGKQDSVPAAPEVAPVAAPAPKNAAPVAPAAAAPAARAAAAPAVVNGAPRVVVVTAPPSAPALTDPRLHQATSLLERGRFEAAARHANDVLAEHPELTAAKILLLVIDARRLRSQFDFEPAIECYRTVLSLDPLHSEANDQIGVLAGELEHSKALFERVFGRGA